MSYTLKVNWEDLCPTVIEFLQDDLDNIKNNPNGLFDLDPRHNKPKVDKLVAAYETVLDYYGFNKNSTDEGVPEYAIIKNQRDPNVYHLDSKGCNGIVCNTTDTGNGYIFHIPSFSRAIQENYICVGYDEAEYIYETMKVIKSEQTTN